jgi:hypothetical protein
VAANSESFAELRVVLVVALMVNFNDCPGVETVDDGTG